MAPHGSYATFRVWGLPANIDVDQAEQILEAFFDSDGVSTEPEVRSLGLDPYKFGRNVEMVATATFAKTPAELLEGDHWHISRRVMYQGVKTRLSLTIDTTFLGFTPLNPVKDDEDHKFDCIVVSGLSSHPFGSWKQRGGDYMWLRDDASWRSPGVRVLLYGYDTSLVRSESFQDIDDIGHKLGDFITRIRMPRVGEINFEPRPIIFIGHSLGGLVIKEAVCHLASTDLVNGLCVYGLLFFGVPNQGIRIEHWLPMVDNQPNLSLVRNLEPESHYLRSLKRRWLAAFQSSTSQVISVYETKMSKTAKEESPGKWALTGKTEVLVTRDSALDTCPEGPRHNQVAMNQNHADLPKFRSPHDPDYMYLTMRLQDFWRDAVYEVQMRLGSEGFFSFSRDPKSDDAAARQPIERARTPEPHPQFFQSPYQNSLAPQFAANHYAFNLNFLAAGQPYMQPGQDIRSLSPFAGAMPYRLRQDQKVTPQFANPEQNDAPPRYEEVHPSAPATDRKTAAVTPEVVEVTPEAPQEKPSLETESTAELESETEAGPEPEPEPEPEIPYRNEEGTATYSSSANAPNSSDDLARRTCSECDVLFPSRTQLFKHRKAEGHWPENKSQTTETEHTKIESSYYKTPETSDFSRRLTCSTCDTLFPSRTQLVKHLETSGHDKEGTDQNIEMEHVKIESSYYKTPENSDFSRRLTCSTCDTLFPSQTQLVKHLEASGHDKEGTDQNIETEHVKIDSCFYKSSNTSDFSRRLTCSTCDVLFPSRTQLVKHLEASGHDQSNTDKSTADAPLQSLSCSVCHMRLPSRTQLFKHIKSLGHWEEKTDNKTSDDSQPDLSCTVCSVQFPSRNQLFRHLKASGHGQGASMDSGALHSAVFDGHLEDVRHLLDKGINVNVVDDAKWTPLHFASKGSRRDVLELLLARGARIDAQTDEGDTPTHLAAKNQYTYMLTLLLQRRASVDVSNQSGKTPLHLAAGGGRSGNVKSLVDAGASVNARDGANWTPLHFAALSGNGYIAEMLVALGAWIDVEDVDGETPLYVAADLGHAMVVESLCESGANVECRDHSGWTPFLVACYKGEEDVVEKLMAMQAVNMKRRDKMGRTAIFLAACRGHVDVIRRLLDTGRIDPSVPDRYGSTALCAAVRNCHSETAELLCQVTRANIYQLDFCGKSITWWAAQSPNPRIRALFAPGPVTGDGLPFDETATMEYVSFCDVCTVPMPDGTDSYECEHCNWGNFCMCTECFERGFKCFDARHALVPS